MAVDLPKIPNAGARHYASWIVRRLRRVRVVGPSMEPTLFDGEVVFVNPAAYARTPPADLDIVVARHPQQDDLTIIKRVEFADENGVYLRSDNADATDAADSRRFGMVPTELVVGAVTAKVPRK